MACEYPTVCPTVLHGNPARHGSRSPAATLRDFGCQAALPIETAHELADVDELRLELDDQDRTGGPMPGQSVDDASLAERREGHFRLVAPAIERSESESHQLMESSMSRVDEPAEVATTPANRQIDACVQSARDRLEISDPDSTNALTLRGLDDSTRDIRSDGDFALRSAASDSDCAERRRRS